MESQHRLLFETKITNPVKPMSKKSMRISGIVCFIIAVLIAGGFLTLRFTDILVMPVMIYFVVPLPLILLGVIFLIVSASTKEAPLMMWLNIYDDEVQFKTSNGNGDFSLNPKDIYSVETFTKRGFYGIYINKSNIVPFISPNDPVVDKLRQLVDENKNSNESSLSNNVDFEAKQIEPNQNDAVGMFDDNPFSDNE